MESEPSTRVGSRAPDPLIGRVIADRYRIVAPLGRGGMGVVYKVEHLRIGKLMAMKLLTGQLSRDRDVVRRFKREALAASRLTSVNTVQVWDFGHADGLTYLVMELVHGEDLGKVLRREGPMPWVRVAKIAAQVCNSLIEAHARGIVHRDLKPENLLLVRAEIAEVQELVKVLDFGLAKLHEDERSSPNEITSAGAIVGTPYYMAPEQIRAEVVDGRADLYALGAVMYRALTGSAPFVAPTPMAVLTMHLVAPLEPPGLRAPELAIPDDASLIVARALEKEPAARFASALALRDALLRSLAGAGISGGFLRTGALEALDDAAEQRSSLGAPARRSEVDRYVRRARRHGVLATLVALVLVGSTAYVVHRRGALPTRDPGAELEPNDVPEHANALVLGLPLRGFLGKRLGPDRGDVDLYALELPKSDGRALVEIDLASLPNIPLCLGLERLGTGSPSVTLCRPRARALHVGALSLPPGRYLLRVAQDRAPGVDGARPPVFENVSDPYTLRVAWAAPRPGDEIEPNDTVADAQAIRVGERVTGTIGWRGDEDVYCAQARGGRARFVVRDRPEGGRSDGSALEVASVRERGENGENGENGAGGANGAEATSEPLAAQDGLFATAELPVGRARVCVRVRLAGPTRTGGAPAMVDAYDVELQPR